MSAFTCLRPPLFPCPRGMGWSAIAYNSRSERRWNTSVRSRENSSNRRFLFAYVSSTYSSSSSCATCEKGSSARSIFTPVASRSASSFTSGSGADATARAHSGVDMRGAASPSSPHPGGALGDSRLYPLAMSLPRKVSNSGQAPSSGQGSSSPGRAYAEAASESESGTGSGEVATMSSSMASNAASTGDDAGEAMASKGSSRPSSKTRISSRSSSSRPEMSAGASSSSRAVTTRRNARREANASREPDAGNAAAGRARGCDAR